MFLKHKAYEYGKTVIDVNEAYTSKTVSWTGELVPNLGGRSNGSGLQWSTWYLYTCIGRFTQSW